MTSLYWHDYETFGANPARDRPSQFAGIRTDQDLNLQGEPLMIYCQPPLDRLPAPQACLITGITPQQAQREGLPEREFAARIAAEFFQPGTCGVGYNSIRFDDEVSRYLFYRNFYDPYEREWKNGNSRWDIIDMLRLARALRPAGIEWPNYPDGSPSFRLEDLTQANGLSHQDAHDALSDVLATIEIAKLVRKAQPELYNYVFENRLKSRVAAQLDTINRKPFLHVSSKLPRENGYLGLMVPLAVHPVNKNAIICFNLMGNPDHLLRWDAQQIRERLFTPTAELPEGEERVMLKAVHLNRCPIVATPKLLDREAAQRLAIDIDKCETNWQLLKNAELHSKLTEVFADTSFATPENAELRLYDGFLPNGDKPLLAQVRAASGAELQSAPPQFADSRYSQLLFHYRANNFTDTLSPEERLDWRNHCFQQIIEGGDDFQTLEQYRQEIDGLIKENGLSSQQQKILESLQEWGSQLLEAAS